MESLSDLIQREKYDEDFDLLEAIEESSRVRDWDEFLREALAILKDPSRKDIWHRSIAVCYWAIPRIEDLPIAKMELVARLYWCLVNWPEVEGDRPDEVENLVWSIAIDLKGVRYESEWDPMMDPEVRKFLSEMD